VAAMAGGKRITVDSFRDELDLSVARHLLLTDPATARQKKAEIVLDLTEKIIEITASHDVRAKIVTTLGPR
jgi:hypothetical protein